MVTVVPPSQNQCHNVVFVITCNAIVDNAVTTPKAFTWKRGQPGSEVVLSDGNQVTITSSGLTNPQSTSQLMTRHTQLGTYRYVCQTDLQVPNGAVLLTDEASGTVTIRGKLILPLALQLYLSVIQWTVMTLTLNLALFPYHR